MSLSPPVTTDPAAFGLTTSVVGTPVGPVTVRHGRRSGLPGAPALVFLHGAAGSWSTFTPLMAAADRRADIDLRDLVIPDLPGWGDSPLPADPAERSIESIAEAVAAVARSLDYDSWMLVGHSLGGFVALDLASAQPEATRAVLLISPTTISVADAARNPVRGLPVLPAFVGMLVAMRVLSSMRGAGTRFVAAIGPTRFFRLAMSPLFANARSMHPSVYRALAAEARPQSFSIAASRAARYDSRRWAGIRCPVRSVRGTRDVFVAASDVDYLAETICDFDSDVIDGAGHFGHIEQADAVLERLVLPALGRDL